MSALVFPTFAGLKIEQTREAIPNTLLPTSITRVEVPFSYETYPRYRYRLDIEVLRSDSSLSARIQEWQKLVGFHARMRGSLDTFLFTDDEDNSATDHNFGVGDATTADFQLQRTLVASADLAAPASRKYWPVLGDGYEPIFDLNGAPTIKKNAVTLTVTTDYTVSATGLVHFVVVPAAAVLLTFTGSWYRRVRFESDSLPSTRIVQSMWSAQVGLLSIK